MGESNVSVCLSSMFRVQQKEQDDKKQLLTNVNENSAALPEKKLLFLAFVIIFYTHCLLAG